MRTIIFLFLMLMVPTQVSAYKITDHKLDRRILYKVKFAKNWEEFKYDKKAVLGEVNKYIFDMPSGKIIIYCLIRIEYEDLEFGEGIEVKGDSYATIEYKGEMFEPDDIHFFVRKVRCNLPE